MKTISIVLALTATLFAGFAQADVIAQPTCYQDEQTDVVATATPDDNTAAAVTAPSNDNTASLIAQPTCYQDEASTS